jgi:hypothetical protein
MAKEPGTGAPKEGRIIREAKNGNTKVIRTTGKRWSDKAEAVFLAELAATCNVKAAAAAAGFSTVAIYNRRAKWPGFREAWDAAIDQGYARIEALLIENATDSLAGAPAIEERPVPPMSVADALNVLRLHRASARGGAGQRYDARAKPPDMEKVRASILRKIDAIERHDARVAAKAAAGAGAGVEAGAERAGGSRASFGSALPSPSFD